MLPTPPVVPRPTDAPDLRAGERALAFFAVAAGIALTVFAYVPRFVASPSEYRPGEVLAYRVDLNRADRAELMQVPGIGPGMADAIVARRNAVGGFGSVNDLNGVKGIGRKTLERVAPHTIVDGSTVLPQTPAIPSNGPLSKLKPGDPPLDANSSTEAELQQLPGIGPAMSARIVAARPFTSVDDLRRVKGIGAKTLENIRPWLVVK